MVFIKINTSTIFIALIVLIVLLLFVLHSIRNKQTGIASLPFELKALFEALGGKENIIASSDKISKLYVELNDYNKLNPNALKKLGATGIISKSNEVVIIFGKASSLIAQTINQEIKK